MSELTDLEKSVLAFEHRRWLHAGAKDEAVRQQFGLTPVRYQQWLLTLIDRPEAYVHDPVLVKRLRRLRDTRRVRRAPRAG